MFSRTIFYVFAPSLVKAIFSKRPQHWTRCTTHRFAGFLNPSVKDCLRGRAEKDSIGSQKINIHYSIYPWSANLCFVIHVYREREILRH